MPVSQPLINSFAVVDLATGNQLMHVVDAANPNDPAFNPPNSVHIPIVINQYATADFAALDNAIIAGGVSQGVNVRSIVPLQPTATPLRVDVQVDLPV